MPVIAMSRSPQLRFFPEHRHDVWELILIADGQGELVSGDSHIPVHAGCIACIPPGVPHTMYGKDVFQDAYIQVPTFSLAGQIPDDTVTVFQDDAEKSFAYLLFMANRVFHKKERNYRALTESLFDAMNQLLLSWHTGTPEALAVEQLKNHMANAFCDPEFSLSDLLKTSHYCTDHLRRLFKKETGFTPLEYLISLRLNYAMKIMKENHRLHYSIAEISALSGFYDCGYFSRVFKKQNGVSPSDYLKRLESGPPEPLSPAQQTPP